MLRIKSPAKGFIIKSFSLLCLYFLPAVCFSQVLNGSFESNGQPSLDHWLIRCDDGESFQDAPSGGGNWCLRLPVGNLQGCSPEIADQIMPAFRSGDILQVSVWVRQGGKRFITYTSVYLKVIHPKGNSTILSADTTTSKEWTQLTVVDTLFLKEGDSIAIILDAGLISGPQPLESYSYFDLVEVEKIGETVLPVNDFNNLFPKDFKLFQNFPNPFNSNTTIRFDLLKPSQISLRIYNTNGQLVNTLVNKYLEASSHEVIWNATNDFEKEVESGVYFCQIQAGEFEQVRKMFLIK
jgi:hypothetical protein